jgi:alpha-tubulin suppressor-like RCC1 family protein
VQVAAGFDFSCGRRASGRVYCWGDNGSSQLGATTSQTCYSGQLIPCSDRPVAVSGGRVYSSISAGRSFVCGIEPSGSVSCWGKNDKAQLGIGALSTSEATPTTLSAMANGTALKFSTLTTGGFHACGIVQSTQKAVCWGSNSIGQLGDGNPGYYSFNPLQQTKPVDVSGNTSWGSLAAGKEHTCGVTVAGIGMCWGSNYYGELGIGPSYSVMDVPTQMNFMISPALTHTISGPDAYGTCFFQPGPIAFCDGANIRGQAGIGQATQNVGQPSKVWGSTIFLSMALGTQHACGTDNYNHLFCWGDNTDGQIGIHWNQQYFLNHPQQVGTATFTGVTSGGNHSCAVNQIGQVYCWGKNHRGQLGIGSQGQYSRTSTPTLILP